MTRPPCYNRPPYATHRNVLGHDQQTGAPVIARLPRWFVDRCATWDGTDIGPNGERYPEAHGWNCSGCRWLPEAFR